MTDALWSCKFASQSIIMITDGVANDSEDVHKLISFYKGARNNFRLFPVGLGSELNKHFLMQLASGTLFIAVFFDIQ